MTSALRELYFWLVANPLALLALFVAGAGALALLGSTGRRLTDRLVIAGQVVTVAVFVTVVTLYYTRAAFIDHVEPQIAAVGWLHHTGHPIYHALDGAVVYSGGPYGPGTILLVSAAYALFGPSLIGAKLSSAAALVFALLAAAAAWRREAPGRSAPLLLEYIGLIALPFGAAFWIRADPTLLAAGTLGVWSVLHPRREVAVAGCLLSLGAVLWLKVHGAFYLFPTFILLGLRHGWASFFIAGFGGVAAALAQLIPWRGHGENYLAVLKMYSSGSSAVPGLIWPMWQWAIFLSAPVWVPLLGGGWRSVARNPALRWPLLALGVTLLVLGVLAARPGLGYWHFLPLAPFFVLLGARMRAAIPATTAVRCAQAGWWFAVTLLVVTRHDDVIARLAANEPAEEVREIETVRAEFPHHAVLMGLGGDVHGPGYRRTFQRAHLAVQGEPYPYDQVVLMDYQFVNAPETLIAPERLLPADRPTLVLVPAGETPWSMRSIFGGRSVPEPFRAHFFAQFELLRRGERYDVWANRARPEAAP